MLSLVLIVAAFLAGSQLGYRLARRPTPAVAQGLAALTTPPTPQRDALALAQVTIGSSIPDPNYGQLALDAWQVCALMAHVPGGGPNCSRCGCPL